ncbi:MAG: hypothetical protein AAGE52_40175 [Myxococcota bacterium]
MPQVAYAFYGGVAGRRTRFYIGPGLRFFGTIGSQWRLAEENAPDDNFLGGDPDAAAIRINDARIASLNAGVYVQLVIRERWYVGANTDLLGVSFGSSTRGSLTRRDGTTENVRRIRPKRLSLFPVSGSYSTEFFWVGYRPIDRLLVRLGFVFSDYKYEIDDDRLVENGDGFERIYPLALVGISYVLP